MTSFTARLADARFHVAVDFGTWGSGFAYGSAYDGDAVRTFEYWEGQRGRPAPKTRTALMYDTSNPQAPLQWGWKAISGHADLPEAERESGRFVQLTRFKLHLMPNDFPDLEPLPPGLTRRKVITDFLRCMYQQITDVLTANYGAR
jgi:hypothetical protein